MSALGQNWTWELVRIPYIPYNVRFTPNSGHWNSVVECPLCAKSGHSFDHFVGDGEHTRRNGQAEHLRGLEIDDKLELSRLLYR